MNFQMFGELSDAFGACGYEEDVLRAAKPYLSDFDVENDAMNNLYIRMPEKDPKKKTILLDAHLDECSGMIQAIEDDGSLRFRLLGNVHGMNLSAHPVIIRNRAGEYIRGIIAAKPVHFMSDEEKTHPDLSVEHMKLDVGACSREEVEKVFGIHIGDPFVPDVRFSYDEKKDLCYGKAFDNRAGCAVVIEIMKKLLPSCHSISVNVTAALAAQEEVGERGATVTSQVVKPDLAIVFEGSPSDDFFFGEGQAQCRMRHGAQIRIMDRSYISNPVFISYAEKIGDKYGIKYQEAVRRGGGTNAGVISLTEKAVPVLVLGVPSRYVHSHCNFCAGEDLASTAELAATLIRDLSEEEINHILRQDILD